MDNQVEKVLIVGSSGHAKVVIDIIEKAGKYEIAGLLDSFRSAGDETFGYKVLGDHKELESIFERTGVCKLFIAIGDNFLRHKVFTEIIEANPFVVFVSAIHPDATIGRGVEIGNGVAVMAGAVINPDSVIHDHVIVNTNASLDHDSVMYSFSSLAPGAVTGGRVTVGECSAISIGAVVRHGISIGKHTVVGAGSVVLKDLPDLKLVYGSPAVIVRDRIPGEKYL